VANLLQIAGTFHLVDPPLLGGAFVFLLVIAINYAVRQARHPERGPLWQGVLLAVLLGALTGTTTWAFELRDQRAALARELKKPVTIAYPFSVDFPDDPNSLSDTPGDAVEWPQPYTGANPALSAKGRVLKYEVGSTVDVKCQLGSAQDLWFELTDGNYMDGVAITQKPATSKGPPPHC
jgi:hypothetical protein